MADSVPLLLDRIRSAIARDPGAPAFLGVASISYGAMRALIGRTMVGFHQRGIRPGQVVALTMSQSPLHMVAFLALARVGATSISVSPMDREADRIALYRRFGVTAVVSEREDAGAPGVQLILLKGVRARGDESEFDTWEDEPVGSTLLRIGLTSGTAGERKGIEQTHEQFARRLDRRYYGDTPKPRVLPPNLHITPALTLACHALTNGGAIVIPQAYDAASQFDAFTRHAVTHVTLPPLHLAMMLTLLDGDAPRFPHIKHLRFVGGTPSASVVAGARRKFTPNVFTTYATTEMGVIAIASPDVLAKTPGSAGPVVPDAQLEVIGEDGRVMPPNEPGEIRVRVPAMPTRYFGDAEPGRFRDGWFHPGDIGYLSDEGLLYIQGRMDDIINLGGRKLAPPYAEAILEEHRAVREAAVFAVDDTHVQAIVALKGALDWRELSEFARRRLDVFAPVRYYEADQLPRNSMGKIVRRELSSFAATGAMLRHTAQ